MISYVKDLFCVNLCFVLRYLWMVTSYVCTDPVKYPSSSAGLCNKYDITSYRDVLMNS